MKSFSILSCLIVLGSNAWASGKCSTASSIFVVSDVASISPHQISLKVQKRTGSPLLEKRKPVVSRLVLNVHQQTPSGQKLLVSIPYDTPVYNNLYQYSMSHMYKDSGASHAIDHSFGEAVILESSELAGKNVTVQVVEHYSCGKSGVAGQNSVSMPAVGADSTPPQILMSNALTLFYSRGTAANGYTMAGKPGSFIKDNVGVKYAELFVNGDFYGRVSYSEGVPGLTYVLGDAELNSTFRTYNQSQGSGFYFQASGGILPIGQGFVTIKAYDFAGNVSEKTVPYPY